MSYTNETTYYGLPLPTGSDKSTFTDNNTAFQAVDAALHTASEGAAQAAEDITSLTGRVGDCETNITNLTTDFGLEKAKIVNLQNKETLQDGEIRDVRSDCEDMISAYNEATSTSTHAYSAGDYFIYNDVLYVATDSIAVGDTIVPDTNCETTNVTTELKSQAGDIAQLNSDLTNVTNRITNQLIVDSTVILDSTFNTDYQYFETTLTKAGYVPIAITGWNCNRTVHNLCSLYIDTDNKIKGTVASTDGNALGVTRLEVYVLYLKTV